jgi:hypothetical protein
MLTLLASLTLQSGILPALLWTGFFALCPLMFKSLANFGSNALSVQGAGKV